MGNREGVACGAALAPGLIIRLRYEKKRKVSVAMVWAGRAMSLCTAGDGSAASLVRANTWLFDLGDATPRGRPVWPSKGAHGAPFLPQYVAILTL